jgi:hypothetical protein
MKIQPVRLNEFLPLTNAAIAETLPFVHSTMAARIFDILSSEKLLATPCNVFKGEKLCYLFVGRPAYKVKPDENPSEWQLPIVFVLRFPDPPPIKRVFPFDSGAFSGRRLPQFITAFNLNGYDIANERDNIGRIISIFFGSSSNYLKRRVAELDSIAEEHNLDLRHQEILALARLYREGSSPDFDDRAAAIEAQVEADISLTADNVLGIVMPSEYARVQGLLQSIAHITTDIETYDIHPISTAAYYGLVYEAVYRIYRRAGIRV